MDLNLPLIKRHVRNILGKHIRTKTGQKKYAPPPGLNKPQIPKTDFNSLIPSKKNFLEILKKRPNKSSPGPNGVPYLVYKKLPCCTDILYTLICRILKEGIFPTSFGTALITLIPKDPSHLNDPSLFRPIACLNVENKILWAVVGQTLLSFLLENGYLIDRTQKGFLLNIAGCIEHCTTLAEAIRDARRNQKEYSNQLA